MPSSALNDLGSDAKSKRFSKAISWMVTEPDSSSSMIADEAVKPPVNDLSSTPTTSSSLASVPRDKEIMPSTNTGPSIMATRSAEDLNSIDHSSSDPSSPHLSILSLSLHNLSSRSESPPKPMAMAPPGPLAVVQRRLSPANSISRRDSTGPVGPRAPRSSGSLRRPISPGPSSLSSAPERTQSSHPLRPLPKPELSRSSTLQVQDQSEAQLALKSEDKDEEGEISTTPPPLPALTPVSVINNGGSSSNESRPTSRPGSRSSMPMPSDDTSTEGGHASDAEGRPGLLGLTKVVSRGGAGSTARPPRISAGAGARRISITSAGDDADRSAKSKWKFWSSGNRPVSMMVDLTKD
ncbi:hypothetical protein BT96DRAFT_916705 [Gymnopus androsaceus JB14]|uniref:Uncharacterized protein n=1 Tax=Gymnopus androsaceus JB14 TaxID=1447944 RepID=A0A6A4I3S1_9AGAR|nr:hypothetical protein BT96DRAFT_916705 [Gymnopus androsaceus JB14]